MKVVYKSQNGYKKTYHPKLGELTEGKEFELPDEKAKKYIEAGLLAAAGEIQHLEEDTEV